MIQFKTHGIYSHAGFLRANGRIHELFYPHVRDRDFSPGEKDLVDAFDIEGITPQEEANFEKWFDGNLRRQIEYSILDLFRLDLNIPFPSDMQSICSAYAMKSCQVCLASEREPLDQPSGPCSITEIYRPCKNRITAMKFLSAKARVLNRGTPPDAFLEELVIWGARADASIFAKNSQKDIYSKIAGELGPWRGDLHRRAAMLEVMRVLAGFESSWDWTDGVDTSRLGSDTPSNTEAGAWQVSYDSRNRAPELKALLASRGIFNDDHSIKDDVLFQQKTKFDHPFAMEYVARLMRYHTLHNGPLYKGDERLAIRRSLRGEEHSIYPWLSRSSVDEIERLLS